LNLNEKKNHILDIVCAERLWFRFCSSRSPPFSIHGSLHKYKLTRFFFFVGFSVCFWLSRPSFSYDFCSIFTCRWLGLLVSNFGLPHGHEFSALILIPPH
jgi:hypothetical protein